MPSTMLELSITMSDPYGIESELGYLVQTLFLLHLAQCHFHPLQLHLSLPYTDPILRTCVLCQLIS